MILVPRPGIKPKALAMESQSLNHRTTREDTCLTLWGVCSQTPVCELRVIFIDERLPSILMVRSINFEPQLSKMLSQPPTKKIPFSSLADNLLPKIVLNYYCNCNSIHKNFVEICFLSCYIGRYIISLIFASAHQT